MLWAGLLLGGSMAGGAIAAAGLLVRPTRLALPLHAVGMAMAFTAGGVLLEIVSERIGRGSVNADTIAFSGFILAFIILPFCVTAALVATAGLKWPAYTTAVSMLTFIVAIASPFRGDAGALLLTGLVSALLVAPTVAAHRYIRTIAIDNPGRRLEAVLGWTLINALFVLFCGAAMLQPLLLDQDWMRMQ